MLGLETEMYVDNVYGLEGYLQASSWDRKWTQHFQWRMKIRGCLWIEGAKMARNIPAPSVFSSEMRRRDPGRLLTWCGQN
jgi:hypothetical protein